MPSSSTPISPWPMPCWARCMQTWGRMRFLWSTRKRLSIAANGPANAKIFYISSHYYENVTRDLDRTTQIYELWRSTFPRDVVPAINLGELYLSLGQLDKAVAEL